MWPGSAQQCTTKTWLRKILTLPSLPPAQKSMNMPSELHSKKSRGASYLFEALKGLLPPEECQKPRVFKLQASPFLFLCFVLRLEEFSLLYEKSCVTRTG